MFKQTGGQFIFTAQVAATSSKLAPLMAAENSNPSPFQGSSQKKMLGINEWLPPASYGACFKKMKSFLQETGLMWTGPFTRSASNHDQIRCKKKSHHSRFDLLVRFSASHKTCDWDTQYNHPCQCVSECAIIILGLISHCRPSP